MLPRNASVDVSLTASGFFAMRTALLPFQTLTDWTDGISLPLGSNTQVTPEQVAAHRAELIERLRGIVSRPEVREAIFLASPSVHEEIDRWLATGKPDPRLERTLTRYVQRMSARATPFGLFAGCSTGRLGERTHLELGSRAEYRRSTRLDNEVIASYAYSLERGEEIRRTAVYRSNTSLYKLGARWRYVQTTVRGGLRMHTFVALDGDEYLDAVIWRAEPGASFNDLVEAVLAQDPDGDIPREEAERYILELHDRDVLVTDLSPLVTGPEPLTDLIEALDANGGFDGAVQGLRRVRERLAALDAHPIGTGVGPYLEVSKQAAELDIRTLPSKLLQVDLWKPAPRAECGADVLAAITEGMQLLHRIAQPPSAWESLRRFREAFVQRYDQREVPLFEVLDEESGIGFDRQSADPVPLLDGIPFGSSEAAKGVWTPRDAYLLKRVAEIYRNSDWVLELGHEDLEALAVHPSLRLPGGLSVMASVSIPPGSSGTTDAAVLIRHASGPSGANILGRFCRMDPELSASVMSHLQIEEQQRPGVLFAEIVHLPAGRLANILGRPVLRRYEIPYLGRSGAPRDHQIPVSDMLVSVREDRIVLRSARLDAEVVPRMTTMHNFSRDQAVYRFLCTLQFQSVASWLGWSWGALESCPFLPRVSHGRIVLSRARWRLERTLLQGFAKGPLHEQLAAVERWRAAWRVPRNAVLADNDNELPVDFENVLSVETFLHLLKSRDQALVFELFPDPETLAAYGPEGRYVHELIVPFTVSNPRQPAAASMRRAASVSAARRVFAPGDDWLYFKLYAGTSTVDLLMVEVIPHLIRRLRATGAVRRWFFLRYADPDPHLRIRLNGDVRALYQEAFPAFKEAIDEALRNRHVWKVQIETYEREVERYGGDAGIEDSEELFCIDSDAVIDILSQMPGDAGLESRWRLCLRSWDLLLSDLGFDLPKKLEIARNGRRGYLLEFRIPKQGEHALGDRFRRERKALERLFDPDAESTHALGEALQRLRRRSLELAPVMARLQQSARQGRLTVPLHTLSWSYLHMHANRFLRASPRRQELVLYDFLGRIYESQVARGKRGQETARPQPVVDAAVRGEGAP